MKEPFLRHAYCTETVKTDAEVNWQHYAHMIERFQDEGKYIWQLSCSFEENAYREQEEADAEQQRIITEFERKKTIEQFHKLIAESIRLIHLHESPESEKSQDIARRYLDMHAQFGLDISRSKHHDVLITDTADSGMHDSFSALRQEVTAFIQQSVKIYRRNQQA